jgi:stearoyl-CoA desaturase (Delta-9 desaturase)
LYYFIWLSLGFLIPTVLGGVIHGTWKGALMGFLWGGFVRIFFNNHLTYWTINSLSHSVGQRHYVTADHSSNSLELLLGLPTLGQSYHNNHHAFPMSSKMSHAWYEVDIGHGLLWLFERAGWVTDRRYPSARQMIIKSQDSTRQFKQGEINE